MPPFLPTLTLMPPLLLFPASMPTLAPPELLPPAVSPTSPFASAPSSTLEPSGIACAPAAEPIAVLTPWSADFAALGPLRNAVARIPNSRCEPSAWPPAAALMFFR